ncbi:MAG: hypothetical protein FJ215_11595 [Ignavibacteria bacterium]|nr:hypothetical protein [Ignavibacteria bacterium]
MEQTFKYKLDFYYQQTLIYLATLVVYVGIKGSFIEEQFTFFYKDPLVIIIALFFVVSLVVLLLNRLRNRKLVINDSAIIFMSRRRQHEIRIDSIEWMYVGRERLVQTAGRFQLVVIKVKGRRRLFRIRVGRYERDRELSAAIERIGELVPKVRRRRFGMQRRRP